MYRCVDATGRVYYSDREGTECEDGKHDRLTRHGLVLDRPAGDMDARPGETNEEHRKRLAQERYDRSLRATYTSEQQIEAAKQRSLETPMLALKWGKKKLAIYLERLAELQQHEAALAENGDPVPDRLEEDIEVAKSDVARLQRELESKQSRVDRIVSRFDEDKKRYRELSAQFQKK